MSEPLRERLARACRSLVAGVVAAWLVLAGELICVALAQRAQLSGVWELQYGTLWLLPTAAVMAGIGGAAGSVLQHWLLGAAREPRLRLVWAGVWALAAAATGWGVGGGRHLASLASRAGLAFGLFLAVLAVAWLLAAPLGAWLRRQPLVSAAAVALLLIVLELVNRTCLVGLYPAFHQALAGTTLLLAPLVLRPLFVAASGAASVWWCLAPATLLALLAVAPAAARKLAGFDNFRLLLAGHAPLLGQAVRLATRLAPDAAWEPACNADVDESCQGLAAPATQAKSVDFTGRDLVLISVDALRADHLGAYGYARATSPNIDALAANGVVFEYAYAPTPHTSYSLTSLMTGKYMRPLLLQGVGSDSETWASILRTYEYRTAAFYPPAVFFIDQERFLGFKNQHFGFEYFKEEFAEGDERLEQIRGYLATQTSAQRLFLWVHWFAPHEPYEVHEAHFFGSKDIDRYDSEIAATDASIGTLVQAIRAERPGAVVMITADHGEEFSEHGGRYHGTSVYEEQVRVPLIVSIPGLGARRIAEPVQTIDLLPTVLAALEIPRLPRLRGRDLGSLIDGSSAGGVGLAVAETDEQALLARGHDRLICARRVGACALYDLASDPRQLNNRAGGAPERFAELRAELKGIASSHGRFEVNGRHAQGHWPGAILRAISGDGDAALEVAELLDDADPQVRRKAAELLFQLKRPETAPALQLAARRADDLETQRFCSLALTRLGQGAALTEELVRGEDKTWRRRAALVLAETGDRIGENTLLEWWQDQANHGHDYGLAKDLLAAFAKLRSKNAVWPLLQALNDVRLAPLAADTLAAIGDKGALGTLVMLLGKERSQAARAAFARAAVKLGAGAELAAPLILLLGVPDPLPEGLGYASKSRILVHVGGPGHDALQRLRQPNSPGVALTVVIPRGGNGKGVRVLVRARALGDAGGLVHLGAQANQFEFNRAGEPKLSRALPRLDPDRSVRLHIPAGGAWTEVYTTLPDALGVRPGQSARLVVYAERAVEVDAIALVPLADELPAPRPKPWTAAPSSSNPNGEAGRQAGTDQERGKFEQ